MFGFLKNLLGKSAAAPAPNPGSCAPDYAPANASSPGATSPAPSKPSIYRNGYHPSGAVVELPLKAVLSGLPLELQARVRIMDVGDLTVSVPLEKILSQLAHGSVRMTFSELRQVFPQVFAPEPDLDRTMVSLPLAEILSRLNPALIKRRRVQKQVQVPAEIASPFDTYAQALGQVPETAAPEETLAAEQVLPPPAPPVRPAPPAPVSPPTPSAPSPIPFQVPPKAARPNGTSHPSLVPPIRSKISSTPTPPPPAATPLAAPAIPASRAMRDFGMSPPATGSSTPQASKPVGEANSLAVSLVALADGWPEAVRKEIVQLNLVDAKVALPTELIERALRQGRIQFSWRMLRAWLKPTAPSAVSPHDGMVLELPLKVVAPLFLARKRESAREQQKVEIDENIPNLFFGFPQPDSGGLSPAAATAKPADTNYYVWDDVGDTVRVSESEVKTGPSIGTKFVSKYATPNEIVSRAAALDGVAGSVISLPDGLLVASQLSPEFNADTLAAFLPQIFGKVSQCTKELRMGELNNLNFTVGNVPWKIFRVNAIFFAAFGRTGEPLPTAQLAALAAELDHKPK